MLSDFHVDGNVKWKTWSRDNFAKIRMYHTHYANVTLTTNKRTNKDKTFVTVESSPLALKEGHRRGSGMGIFNSPPMGSY